MWQNGRHGILEFVIELLGNGKAECYHKLTSLDMDITKQLKSSQIS
jgi:hypothetical protein